MRTTVEFAPDLMRAAKARSALQGESLKAFLTRAVAAALGDEGRPASPGRRVVLPLFGETAGPPVELSNADLEQALADADAASAGARAPRARSARRGGGRRRTRR